MLYEISRFLIDVVGGLLASACLLRAWMQWLRLPARNPLGVFIQSLTDWLVRPLRRVIPGWRGVDWASIVAAFLVALTSVLLATMASGALAASWSAPGALLLFSLALVWTLKWALYLALIVVLVAAVMSWINPHAPLLPLFDSLAAPLLRPIRRILPLMGRFDLSPLVLILLIQIALIALRNLSIGSLGIY